MKDEPSTGSRINVLSRDFVGHSYKPNPLIGSANTPEVFTASLDGFDCVTYLETKRSRARRTILALTRASKVDDFIEWLRKIRYDQGRIRWERRNHYMTLWIRNNVREGIIKPVSIPAVPIISRECVLNVVPGLAAQRTHLKCVPKAALRRLAAYLQGGDLMFSCPPARIRCVSIVRDGSSILMRHASRSQGFVVERELREFLKANRMAGVIVVRPQGVTRRIAQTEDGAKLWGGR